MYCYDFICTYKMIDEEFRDILYKQQLLEAFNIKDYDPVAINDCQETIYNELKSNSDFKLLLEKIKVKFPQLCQTELEALSVLFSYDYFDIFHRYLIEHFINDNVNPIHHKNLMEAII